MTAGTGYFINDRADTLLSHRILCDSGGRLWVFFQNRYRSLCCGYSDDRGSSWSPALDLMAGISGPFSVCAGEKGGLHLAARSFHPQDVCLLSWNGKKWAGGPVYRAQEKGAATFFPLIKTSGPVLHLIFAARRYPSGVWSVVHLRPSPDREPEAGGFELPGPAGGLSDWSRELRFLSDSLYWTGDLAVDGRGGLHLAYRAFWQDGYHLFYSFLPPGQPRWDGPERLTAGGWCSGHPSLHASGDRIYLLYRLWRESGHEVKIMAREGDRWHDGPAVPLSSGGEIRSDGFLPGGKGPGAYWAGPEGCWFLPFGGTRPELIFRPEGKKIYTFAAAAAENRLCLAWTEREDPLREIRVKVVENHL